MKVHIRLTTFPLSTNRQHSLETEPEIKQSTVRQTQPESQSASITTQVTLVTAVLLYEPLKATLLHGTVVRPYNILSQSKTIIES